MIDWRSAALWAAETLDGLASVIRRRAGLEQPPVRVETRTLAELDELAARRPAPPSRPSPTRPAYGPWPGDEL